jgi:hypothetical protein
MARDRLRLPVFGRKRLTVQGIRSITPWNWLLPVILILAGIGITTVALAADLFGVGGPQGVGPSKSPGLKRAIRLAGRRCIDFFEKPAPHQ